MFRTFLSRFVLSAAVAAVCFSAANRPVSAEPILTPLGSIPLPGVEGRMDHFAVDAASGRVFVSALENHTIEVLDVVKRKRLRTISGIREPQGILFVPGSNRVLVCSRGDGTLRSFDARTFVEGPWVDLGHNADNLRLDTATNTVYVGSGGEPGTGMLSATELASLLPVNQGGKAAEPRSPADLLLGPDQPRQGNDRAEVELDSHPESFQVDTAGHRIYVNVPDSHNIAVIDDTAAGLKISAMWPVTLAKRNFPMSLDVASSRLYIACRNPALLIAYDTNTGEVVSQMPCTGDADDLYFDSDLQRLYLIGGDGSIDVFSTVPGATGGPTLLSRVPTASKARTGTFIPSLHMIMVAVPHTDEHPASIMLFRVNK